MTNSNGSDPSDPSIDLTNPSEPPSLAERSAQYSAWAERMRTKRTNAKQHIATAQGVAPHDADGPPLGYWDPAALFADAERLAHDEAASRPDPAQRASLLARLGLPADADAEQVTSTYRSLAKVHHPDRWVSADEATRSAHQVEMLAINRAYRGLREPG